MKENRKKETKRQRKKDGYEVRITQISMQITNRTSDHVGFHVSQWPGAFH